VWASAMTVALASRLSLIGFPSDQFTWLGRTPEEGQM
jgi:hypothetical protein